MIIHKSRHNISIHRILLFIFIPLLLGSCGEITSSESAKQMLKWQNLEMAKAEYGFLSDKKKEWYRTSAEKISLKYVNEIEPEQIEISHELADLFFHGLIHIYNSDLPEAYRVTRESPIYATQPHDPYEILVFADTVVASSWLDNWRDEQTKTGDTLIDNLIEKFDYTLVRYSELANILPRSLATLRSDRLLNGYATGRKFEEHPAINSAYPEPVYFTQFASDIEAEVREDHIYYEFIGSQYNFKVYGNGSVNVIHVD